MEADLAKLADKMLRAPRCSRCRNHGFLVPVKGHAGKCRWKQCTCKKCYLITQRQKITAAQQVLQKQVSEEEQEMALCAQGPQLASGDAAAVPGSSLRPLPLPVASGDAHPGPEGRATACFLERPQQGWSPGRSTFQPVLGGRGHVGPSKQAAAAMPSSLRPQLGAEAAGRGCPGRLELSRSLRPVPSPPFANFGKILGRAPRGLALLLVPLQAAASPLPTPASQARLDPAGKGWGWGRCFLEVTLLWDTLF